MTTLDACHDRRAYPVFATMDTTDTALLVLRVVIGTLFLVHGVAKLRDPAGTEKFFASLGIPAPRLMAPAIGLTEAGGGLLLVAGFLTPLVAAVLAIDMLVALVTAHIRRGLPGGELAIAFGAVSLALVLTGAGEFSADELAGLG